LVTSIHCFYDPLSQVVRVRLSAGKIHRNHAS
jgi:hypothetical protein